MQLVSIMQYASMFVDTRGEDKMVRVVVVFVVLINYTIIGRVYRYQLKRLLVKSCAHKSCIITMFFLNVAY